MSLTDSLMSLYGASIALNSVFIVTILLAISRVLVVLPLKYFDRKAKIVMAAIVVTMCSQLLGTFLYQEIFEESKETESVNKNTKAVKNAKNVMDIVNMVGDMAIWLTFFLFVYELKSVIVILSSPNMHEMGQALKRTKREKYLVVGISQLMSTLYHGIAAIMLTMNEKDFNKSKSTFRLISTVSRCGYIICFLYLLTLWFQLVF